MNKQDKKFARLFWQKLNLKRDDIVFWVLYIAILYLLTRIVMEKSLGFFFWKDDWYLKWAGTFDPNNFYNHFPYWQLRAPEFWLRQIITDSRTWQYIGILLKVLNSFIFALFVKYFTRKRDLAVWSGILYSVYSGGLEVYTWAIINGVLITSILVGIIKFDSFLNLRKKGDLILSLILFGIANALYFGRALGLVPFIYYFILLFLIRQKRKFSAFYVLAIFLGIPLLILVMNLATSFIGDLNWKAEDFILYFKQYKLFLGSIGNLVRVPFWKLYEVGGLAVHDDISRYSGLILVLITLLFFMLYLRKRTRWLFLVNISLFWVFIFYFFNWMWGGGGVYTMVGSTHRYLAISATGYLFFIVLIVSKLPKKYRNLVILVLIVLFTKYTLNLIDIEDNVRNRSKVEPIYKEVVDAIPPDIDTPFILIDTPNELKSFVVDGWFPYTFGYYRGIMSQDKLPTVFSFKIDAVRWFCERDKGKRRQIAMTSGAPDYSSKDFTEEEIFAWHLEESGKLSDLKGTLVSDVRNCID